MGYYLNIKLTPKSENIDRPMTLLSCRFNSNPIAAAFNEAGLLPKVSWDEDNSRKLTKEDMEAVIKQQKGYIDLCKDRLLKLYKILSICGSSASDEVKQNLGVDSEAVTTEEEWLEELNKTLTQLEMIAEIVSDTYDDFNDFKEVSVSVS